MGLDGIGGIEIIASPSIPRPGLIDKLGAASIRRENLDVLLHGGSLIECEKPTVYSPGIFMINGQCFMHPDTRRKVVALLNER
jgi:hypothetical protein